MSEQGVASFAYSPADKSMPFLFEFQRPLDDLAGMLVQQYAGMKVSMDDLYRTHSVGRPYLRKHYKEVLMKLEYDGIVSVSDPEGKARRQNTLADRLLVSFVRRNG